MVEMRDRSPRGEASCAGSVSGDRAAVRRFVSDDIPQVADLHRRVFRIPESGDAPAPGGGLSPSLLESYERYFDEVFLNGPWSNDRIRSLVYDEGDGRIAGFLGVIPRPMLWNDTPVQMAVCSQFVVDPQRRGQVGLRLLAEHFKGPQDLSISDEANEGTRRVWEARGGGACPSYCVRWIRVLRPARFALSVAARRKRFVTLARGCAPIARIVDAAATRWRNGPFRPPAPGAAGEELDDVTLLTALPELAGSRTLRPQLDRRSWRWTLERAGLGRSGGGFHKVAVPDGGGIAGWYIYRLDTSGMGEVLQMAARSRRVDEVFGHLLQHAWQRGALALAGRLDPPLFKELSDRYCLFRFAGSSMLVHARRPELLQPLYSGDAFLTRLEGEWCLRFRLQ